MATEAVWLLITALSTFVTVYAINSIFQTAKQLEISNSNVDINKKTMILHSSLLITQCVCAAFYAMPCGWHRERNYITISMTIIEVVLQLAVCFICVTMGSSVQLRKF